MINYLYDGTFSGLLSAIFDSYDRRDKAVSVYPEFLYSPDLFLDEYTVITDEQKALRVWKGLQHKLSDRWQLNMYMASFTENREEIQHLFDCIHYIFDSKQNISYNYGNEHVISVAQTARKVHKERHRIVEFLRFQHTVDGMFFAKIDPLYNVLPLVRNHFKNRYADQQWIIYDTKRRYGVYYDLHEIKEVTFNFDESLIDKKRNKLTENMVSQEEELYNNLWKDYYKSINIAERKNSKLQKQFLPQRFWKNLIEMNA